MAVGPNQAGVLAMANYSAQVWSVHSPTTGAKTISLGQAFIVAVGTTVQFGAVSGVVESGAVQARTAGAAARFQPGAVAGLKRCCAICGRPLPFAAWLSGQRICDPCSVYESALGNALGSSNISQQAISDLAPVAARSGVMPEDRLLLHERAFRDLCQRAAQHQRFSPGDLQRLASVAQWLQLPNTTGSATMSQLRRLCHLQYDPLPCIAYSALRLQPGEVCHWVERGCRYYEEQTHRERQGAYSGYNMRVGKGMSYHVGGMSGYSYPVSAIVCVDTGDFIVTSSRVGFVGAHRGFGLPFKKLLSLQVFTNGVRLQADGARTRPQLFVLADVDTACIVLTRAMNAAL